jgi:hypothetical protein
MEAPMSTTRRLLAIPLILLFAAFTPAFAGQRHLVEPSQLARTINQHLSAQDADRAAVREALARPDVRDVASELGLDLTRATAAIDTLEGPALERAGQAARQVNQQLVGGASTITLTTTTLIIILLVVILIIVAVK